MLLLPAMYCRFHHMLCPVNVASLRPFPEQRSRASFQFKLW